MKDWNVLTDRKVIDILIGDTAVISQVLCEYKMPYMSGPTICEFATDIGFNIKYDGKLSRWQYMYSLIEYVTHNELVSVFFRHYFNIKRFREVQVNISYRNIQLLYWDLVHKCMEAINNELYFESVHIEYNVDSWTFNLVDDENRVELDSSSMELIDNSYIKQLKHQIDKTIIENDYESTITKSRTLLEEIMIYGINKKGETTTAKGDINKLYNQFKDLYQMHGDKNLDIRINTLLSGLEKIITSVTEMRNLCSDSHGVGNKRISIKSHHAVLFANASITMVVFLLDVINNDLRNNK